MGIWQMLPQQLLPEGYHGYQNRHVHHVMRTSPESVPDRHYTVIPWDMAAYIAVHVTEVLMQCIHHAKHQIIISQNNIRVLLQQSRPSEAVVSAMNHREVKTIRKSSLKSTGVTVLKKQLAAGLVIHLSLQPQQAGRTLTPGKTQTDTFSG
jgi:hypothetical protein